MNMYLHKNTILQEGKYKIVRHISSGGFGNTYEGFDFIDPHDGNGQYEKRGSYYTCAIFSNDNKAIIHFKKVARALAQSKM